MRFRGVMNLSLSDGDELSRNVVYVASDADGERVCVVLFVLSLDHGDE